MADIEQSENDVREIELRHDLPPDGPHWFRDEEEPCEHPVTRELRVYQERRTVCATCGTHLATRIEGREHGKDQSGGLPLRPV